MPLVKAAFKLVLNIHVMINIDFLFFLLTWIYCAPNERIKQNDAQKVKSILNRERSIKLNFVHPRNKQENNFMVSLSIITVNKKTQNQLGHRVQSFSVTRKSSKSGKIQTHTGIPDKINPLIKFFCKNNKVNSVLEGFNL